MKFRYQILLILAACCATPAAPVFRAQAAAPLIYRNTIDLGVIDTESTDAALTRLKTLAAQDVKEVTLRIDSPGGNIIVGLAWIRAVEDVKKLHGVHVTCAVDGLAMSMAAVILESPVCDSRIATTRSTFLFHNGSAAAEGTAVKIQTTVTLLEALNEAMGLLVSARLQMPYNVYRAKLAAGDWIMTTREALAANVIDGLASPSAIMPPVDG